MDALPSWSVPGFPRNPSAGPGSLHSGAIVLFATLAFSESAMALSQEATPPDSVPARLGVDPEAVPRPSTTAGRASGPISVDGFLNEPSWTEAEIITGFVQSKPNAGYPSSEHTEIRILYDDETLYVGATLYYQDPSNITLHSLKRDFPAGESDILGIAFDTYLDRSNAFMFGVNAGGAMVDLQTFDNGRDINFAWDGIADRAVRVHDEGWTAEVAVPFSTLRFDPNQPDRPWGLNFVRRLRHKGEDSFWAPIDRRYSLNRMSEAGTLTGLPAMSGGLNLLVKPFALTARSSGDAATEGVATDFDAGMDVKYALSQGLALDLTYRTDFSQVEVDDEQVNLTRFSLFFPEKRDFFVENAGLFDFGDLPERGYRLGAGLEDLSARQLLMAGVTTARDLGAPLEDAIWVRDEINAGRMAGPRLFVSGPFLQKSLPVPQGTGYDYRTQAFVRWTVDGPEDAARKARQLIDAGVDVIKVIQLGQLTREERLAIAGEARRAGLHMAVHAGSVEEVRAAAEMGVGSIEHMGGGRDPLYPEESLRLIAENGIVASVTSLVSRIYDITTEYPERLDNLQLKSDLPADIYEDVRSSLDHFSRLNYFSGAKEANRHHGAKVRQLYENGVRLVIGTDSGTPMNFHYESTWQEMDLFVRYGIPPMKVISMATRYPALLYGEFDDLGTIEPGKLADIIVVNGNPLRNMSALQQNNVIHVIKSGVQYKGPGIDPSRPASDADPRRN